MLKIVKRADGWWIIGGPGLGEHGAYATKWEAEEDRRGLERHYREKFYEREE